MVKVLFLDVDGVINVHLGKRSALVYCSSHQFRGKTKSYLAHVVGVVCRVGVWGGGCLGWGRVGRVGGWEGGMGRS